MAGDDDWPDDVNEMVGVLDVAGVSVRDGSEEVVDILGDVVCGAAAV